MSKTKRLVYKGAEGYLEGFGFVSAGDVVTFDAERAKALLKSQPEQWSDRTAPDKPGAGKKKSFRDEIVEKGDK
jgi:hypothetical protein